jgi:hypothetical protein
MTAGGDGTQVSALQAALAAKGLRKPPSLRWAAIRAAAARIWIWVFFSGMALLIVSELFRRRR